MSNTISSNQARQHWSQLLNATLQGQSTIIERYGGPIAVVIPYYQWMKQQTVVQSDEQTLRVADRKDEVTEALNQVYATQSSEIDPIIVEMQNASLGGETW